MFSQRILSLLGVLGLGTLLAIPYAGPARGQAQPPGAEEGVEVQARGPIHEGFAEPVGGQPVPGPILPKAPPEPLEELPPDQKPEGENVQWIPGYWGWDDDRKDYLWVSGFWRVPPPNRQWVPGHWLQVAGGWQWTPGYWAMPQAQEIQFLPPPPAVIEEGPSVPAPGVDYTYAPGCWVWHTSRYLWRPGHWLPFRPGFVWVPAHYQWTPAGCVFVDGYWDYDLARRGLLFAPVYIAPQVWGRPRWVFQPRYTVQLDFMLGSLWVRPGWRHYYFGDYFDPLYQRRGYTAWFDVRLGRHGYDPLFTYYRRQHAHDRRWERDLRDLYVGRTSGTIARPPRTLGQQTTVIQNLTVQKNTTNIRNVTAVTPLAQVTAGGFKLQPLTQDRRREEQVRAQQLRDVSRQRNQQESKVVTAGPPRKTVDAPRVVKLDLPKTPGRGGIQLPPKTDTLPQPGKPGVQPQPGKSGVPPQPGKPPITTVQPPGKPGLPSRPDVTPRPGVQPVKPPTGPPQAAPQPGKPVPQPLRPKGVEPPRTQPTPQPGKPPQIQPTPLRPAPQVPPQPVKPPPSPAKASPGPVIPQNSPPQVRPQFAPQPVKPPPAPARGEVRPQPTPQAPQRPLTAPPTITPRSPPLRPEVRPSPPPRIERAVPPPGKAPPSRSDDKDKKKK